jgi:hypothetical protein
LFDIWLKGNLSAMLAISLDRVLRAGLQCPSLDADFPKSAQPFPGSL